MCSGLRDAANLGWKLALVTSGAASESLLASYQAEREPNVRQVIGTAVEMGRIICTQDPEAARARDASFIERPNSTLEIPDMPGLATGVVHSGSALAGKLALQARVRAEDGGIALLDDVTGPGFTLLLRGAPEAPLRDGAGAVLERIGAKLVSIDREMDVDGAYRKWFDRHECDAVLVRPDHQVFGAATGVDAASELLEAFALHL
jgi:hypothetical protein